MADWNGSILELLRETFEGMKGDGTWYSDSEPNAGILGTCAKTTAAQASERICGKNTMAAQAIHTAYYLEVVLESVQDPDFRADWEGSWKEQTVSEERWQEVQSLLRSRYEQYKVLVESVPDWEDADAQIGALAALCHCAFHLGAIRQMIR
jgi:hypothetical protein